MKKSTNVACGCFPVVLQVHDRWFFPLILFIFSTFTDVFIPAKDGIWQFLLYDGGLIPIEESICILISEVGILLKSTRGTLRVRMRLRSTEPRKSMQVKLAPYSRFCAAYSFLDLGWMQNSILSRPMLFLLGVVHQKNLIFTPVPGDAAVLTENF